MGRYTLWCLNQVAAWNRRALADALEANGRHTVSLGSRARFDQDPGWEEDPYEDPRRHGGVLMHEGEGASPNEYFVPIAVKCIGDPQRFGRLFGPRMTERGRQLFEDLKTIYARYFTPAPGSKDEWRRYWTGFDINNALWKVQMFTRADGDSPYMGLYELVAAEAETKGKGVLVGYSQGGLVARFLAWIDEQWMNKPDRVIAGFITVQAPNHGSPLANKRNAGNVAVGLGGALTGLAGYSIVGAGSPSTRAALARVLAPTGVATAPVGIAALCEILDGLIDDPPPENADRRDIYRTARKWLTGLAPFPASAGATAFDDLDPQNLDVPGTILGRLVSEPPPEIPHGAIIGADTKLDDLVLSALPWWERPIARLLIAKRLYDAVERPYAQVAMNEADAGADIAPTPLHARIAALYRSGTEKPARGIRPELPSLPAFAHDFVIPSISQALHVLSDRPDPPSFLANVVNPRATHASGGNEHEFVSDRRVVLAMLRKLGAALA